MLGCQDFCGYYDWTFQYVARTRGDNAVRTLWADAIGGDAQDHYLQAARRDGLRGLFNTWVKTGDDEHCDWTFSLDESRNTLRWDMRRCPSKGFLLNNDLNASEDYCDHCMGWIIPLLEQAGMRIGAHEHNHCGQCWAEIHVNGRPVSALQVGADIRNDPRWSHGYVERWEDSQRSATDQWELTPNATIVSGAHYASDESVMPDAVLIDAPPVALEGIARRWLSSASRPRLLYGYFPRVAAVDFTAYRLPRPFPILPKLIAAGLYDHRPGNEIPSSEALIGLLRQLGR